MTPPVPREGGVLLSGESPSPNEPVPFTLGDPDPPPAPPDVALAPPRPELPAAKWFQNGTCGRSEWKFGCGDSSSSTSPQESHRATRSPNPSSSACSSFSNC